MIVVADTSVILNLCCVRHEGLLQQLFKRVLIPDIVAAEFARLSHTQLRFGGLALPTWIEVLPAPKTIPVEVIQANLDSGEAAAIGLCLNQKEDALLIDEALGRQVATGLGLQTIGILSVLVESKNLGFLSGLRRFWTVWRIRRVFGYAKTCEIMCCNW